MKRKQAADSVAWKDAEAVRRLLAMPPRGWYWTAQAPDSQLGARLAEATTQATAQRRLTALLCRTDRPMDDYLVVRLIDLPHLAVAIYDRLVSTQQ